MKIFLLVMLLYMFIKRIVYTPTELSHKLWENKLAKSLKKLESKIKEIKIESMKEFGTTIVWDMLQIIVIMFVGVLYVLYTITYAIVGFTLGSTYLLVLSVIQVILTLYSLRITFGNNWLSTKIEDYKFCRRLNLTNVIVDYMYYPVAIWMLLMM